MRGFSFQLSKPTLIAIKIIYFFLEIIFIIIARLFMETPKEIFIRTVLRIGVSRRQAKLLRELIMARKEQCADDPYINANDEMLMGAKVQNAGKKCREEKIAEWRINWVFKM